MSYIANNVMFKCSKHRDKILAAYNNPINRQLVQQIDNSYNNPDLGEEVEVDEAAVDKGGSTAASKPKPKSPKGFSGGYSGGGFSDSGLDDADLNDSEFDNIDTDNADNVELDVPEDVSKEDTSDADDIDESTNINKQPIHSSTYVTVESVSNAVNILPGTLNMKDETKGASQVILRGGKDNEVWIYYDPEIKLTNILEDVNNTLLEQNMYFLEFDRVARDDNAIVYNINWVSNYFNPLQLNKNE